MSENGRSNEDWMALSHAAGNDAFRTAIEQHKDLMASLVTRPAVPLSDKKDEVFAEQERPKADQRREYLALRADPVMLAATFSEMQARAGLPRKHSVTGELLVIPREFIALIQAGERLLRQGGNIDGEE